MRYKLMMNKAVSNKEILASDFLIKHRSYFSVYRPTDLSYLLEQLPQPIPQNSLYHVIRGWKVQCQVKVDYWFIIEKYLILSMNSSAIIDLEMPYKMNELLYEGRYIIYKGQLMGIRINTLGSLSNIMYSKWPRNYTIVQKYPQIKSSNKYLQNKKRNDFIVGDFSIKTINIRIGIIFGQQISTKMNQYIQHGFQLVIGKVNKSKNSGFATKVFILDIGDNISQSTNKNQILYIDFTKYIATRFRPSPIFDEKDLLFQLEIPLIMNVPFDHSNPHIQILNDPLYEQQSNTYLAEQGKSNSALSQQNIVEYKERFNILKTILKNCTLDGDDCPAPPIILPLTESPQVFCILALYKMTGCELSIHCINYGCIQVNLLAEQILRGIKWQLSDIHTISPNFSFQSPEIISINSILEFVQLFKQLLTHYSKLTNFVIPVLTSDPSDQHILNAITTIFQLNNQSINTNHNPPNLIPISLFTYQQVQNIIKCPELRQLIPDNRLYQRILNKLKVNKMESNKQSIKNLINNSINLHNSPENISKQLQSKQINQQGERTIFTKLFWVMAAKPYLSFKDKSSFFFEAIKLGDQSSGSYYKLFVLMSKQLAKRYENEQIELEDNKMIEEIDRETQIQKTKQQCHKCRIKFKPHLMYQCSLKFCKQIFCFKCLKHFFQQNMKMYCMPNQKKSKGSSKQLTNCPVCLQKCNVDNCQNCKGQIKNIKKCKKQVKKCHYCNKQSTVSIKCSKCPQQFCYSCSTIIFSSKQIKIDDNWSCYVCRKICWCGFCLSNRKIQLKSIDGLLGIANGFTFKEKQLLDKLRNQQNNPYSQRQTSIDQETIYNHQYKDNKKTYNYQYKDNNRTYNHQYKTYNHQYKDNNYQYKDSNRTYHQYTDSNNKNRNNDSQGQGLQPHREFPYFGSQENSQVRDKHWNRMSNNNRLKQQKNIQNKVNSNSNYCNYNRNKYKQVQNNELNNKNAKNDRQKHEQSLWRKIKENEKPKWNNEISNDTRKYSYETASHLSNKLKDKEPQIEIHLEDSEHLEY